MQLTDQHEYHRRRHREEALRADGLKAERDALLEENARLRQAWDSREEMHALELRKLKLRVSELENEAKAARIREIDERKGAA